MASLSRYYQSPEVQTSGGMLDPGAADTGADAIGKGLQSFGQSIDNINERDDDFWVQKTLSDADKTAGEQWDSATQNATDGAPGFKQNFTDNLQKQHDQYLQQAPSGRAQKMLDLGLTKQRDQWDQKALGFESQEKTSFKVRQIGQEADNLGQAAMRDPGVEPYSPQGRLIPPGTIDASARPDASGYYTNAHVDEKTGVEDPDNLSSFKSAYYAPQDFADGKNIQDKTGAIQISKRLVAGLDWVTDQFGMGKLQINSGYRSPSSNLARAESGADGPHTHGEAVDIETGDLPQDKKNQLYSLLKTQGFNAFGFGTGVLHAEIRPGKGNGRGGDFEWTYNGAPKYQQVPVATPDVDGTAPSDTATGDSPGLINARGPAWKTPNQYPQMNAAGISSQLETGKTNLVEASAQIAPDSRGTKSYGMFGINSGGTMQSFVDRNQDLGLTATPGSPEFDQQWTNLVQKNPQKLVNAQLQFHQDKVVEPARRSLVTAGLGKFSNDPRALAFVSDMVVQYGPGGVEKHLLAAAGSQNIDQFVNSASNSMRDSLNNDFHDALDRDPSQRTGLLNRIDQRSKEAMQLGSGGGNQPITGNVPAWNGPIPDINNVPGYSERLSRVNAMVDTMGGTPEQRRQVRDQMTNQITRAWLSSVAQTNPSAAMAALHSGKYDDAISIGDENAISGQANNGWKDYENEIRTSQKQLLTNLQQEAHANLSDEIASLANTGKSLGKLSDAQRAMLTDDDKEQLGLAKAQYTIGQKVSTANASELPAILDGLKPQGDGFATEQKQYDYAEKLINARLTKQATDPAGYVISSSKQISDLWQNAMGSNDPQAVQSAIQTIRRTQKAQGVPDAQIRSITQTSEENNAKLLDGAPDADTAFSRFNQLRTMYGGESAAVFSEMEAHGGTKGWSAVNELMDSGNVVLAKSLARVVQAKSFKGDADIGMRLARAGQPDVARTIFDGRVRRDTVKGLEPAGNSEDDKSVNQVIGAALGDALDLSPKVLDDAREAAKSYVANSAALGEKWDADKLTEAVQKVTGGVLEHNSDGRTGKLVAPVAGFDQKSFDTALLGLKDSDLKGAFVGFSNVPAPVTADMVRNTMQFVSVGNGKYSLRYPNAGLARDEKGLPYQIDLGAILPQLAKRGATAAAAQQKAMDMPAGADGTLEAPPNLFGTMSLSEKKFWFGAAANGVSVKDALGIKLRDVPSYGDTSAEQAKAAHDFWFGTSGKTLKQALAIDLSPGEDPAAPTPAPPVNDQSGKGGGGTGGGGF